MFQIAVIIFRECLEISCIIGIIMAGTRSIAKSRLYIMIGFLVGILGAFLIATLTQLLDIFDEFADEINVLLILTTSFIICWTVSWMHNYAKDLKQNMENISMQTGITSKILLTMSVAFVIFREGSEIVLFVYSIASAGNIDIYQHIFAIFISCISGLLVGMIIYLGLIRFTSKYIFSISGMLLTLIAAGLASEAGGIMTSSGMVDILADELWDTSNIIANESKIGRISNILIGYEARPNSMQVILYFTTIGFTILTKKIKSRSVNV